MEKIKYGIYQDRKHAMVLVLDPPHGLDSVLEQAKEHICRIGAYQSRCNKADLIDLVRTEQTGLHAYTITLKFDYDGKPFSFRLFVMQRESED